MAEWQYRYLLFVPPATGAPSWRLARYADTNVKYAAPAYRLDAMPGRSFLVLEHDTGGTGVYERGETWYDIAPGADGVALTLPIDGHDEVLSLRSGTGGAYVLQHEWKSNIVHRPEAAGDA